MPTLEPVTRISIKNILLATDFSKASVAAVPFALAFARLYGARLVAAHVMPPEPLQAVVADRLRAQDDRDWQDAKEELRLFAHDPSFENTPCQTLLEAGDLADVIPSLIQDHEIELVVLGTRGRRGLSKVLLGSGAEKVYRSATCPVLTVGPEARREAGKPWKMSHILFPIDLEQTPEPARHHALSDALHYGLSLAEEQQATLTLLHADPLVPWQYRESVEERVVRSLSGMIPEDAKLWCEPQFMVRWDYPADAILQAVHDRGTDLIVMGVHKASASTLSSHLPWPIASEVVSRASCPVLTVRV